MDLRKIIEGSDPSLAQKLVESNFFWITDLTEPDPWYGLPIATGALLYMNVEVRERRRKLDFCFNQSACWFTISRLKKTSWPHRIASLSALPPHLDVGRETGIERRGQ
jgi:hypothetical protein